MDFNEYQGLAVRTLQPEADDIYLSGQLVSEATEIFQPLLKRTYHGKPVDWANIREEMGDCLWYLAALANHYGWDLSDIAAENIGKLTARHGETYNAAYYMEVTK